MRLTCPFCGLRDEGEFSYEGPVMAWPALDAPQADWVEAVFLRDQPKGETQELWRHVQGCGCLLEVVRNTVTHEILSTAFADDDRDGRAFRARLK